MDQIDKIRVGLIGYGAAARVMHAPFLATNPGYEVVSVLERHHQDSRQRFPKAKIVRSMEEMLQTDAELLIITTPNETHFPYTKQSLEAGKHVVLEKPFTIKSEDSLKLIGIAREQNRILSVFHNRRYVADFLTIREILAKKLLGEIHEFEGRYDRFRPDPKPGNVWREQPLAGSGILYDLGPHLIDQAFCLFGLPVYLSADIRTQRPWAKTDDYFDIELDYGFNKVILKSGMLVREMGPRYMIQGTKGSFIKYGEDPQEERLKEGELPVSPDWGREEVENYGLLHTEIGGEIIKTRYVSHKGNFGMYYDNLYQTLRFNKPLKERPEQGYNTIRIVELAMESSRLRASLPCTGLLDVPYD